MILKFGTSGSLSNMTFESYARRLDWRRSVDSLLTLFFSKDLKKLDNFEIN